MKLRERLANMLRPELSREIEQQRHAISLLAEAYQDGPWLTTPGQLVEQIREQLDADTIALLLDQLQYEDYGTEGRGTTDQERLSAVTQARGLFRYNPLAQWAVMLWTGWGMGDNVSVQMDTEAHQGIWDEFYTAQRNAAVMGRKELGEMSDWLLVTGNRLLVLFTSTATGATTVRVIDGVGVEAICNPNDKNEVWFYRRSLYDQHGGSVDLYYPEWHTLIGADLEDKWGMLRSANKIPRDAQRIDLMRTEREVLGVTVPGTMVSILHIAHNRKDEDSPWGWPLTTCATPWLRSHKRFMQARLQVALSKAAIVRQTTVKGGSRAVSTVIDSIRSRISASTPSDTNPPPGPGSWMVQNDASKTEEKPMTTGAGDAKIDWELFSYTALLAMGIFPTSAGMDTSRWATALEMDKAQSMIFGRYSAFWQSAFTEIATAIVSLFYHARGQGAPAQIGVSVTSDMFSLADLPSLASTCSKLTTDMIVPAIQNGTMTTETGVALVYTMWRMILQAFGLSATDMTMPDPADAEPADTAEGRARATSIALRRMSEGKIAPDEFAEYVGALWAGGS